MTLWTALLWTRFSSSYNLTNFNNFCHIFCQFNAIFKLILPCLVLAKNKVFKVKDLSMGFNATFWQRKNKIDLDRFDVQGYGCWLFTYDVTQV